jgi:hypothetical protein
MHLALLGIGEELFGYSSEVFCYGLSDAFISGLVFGLLTSATGTMDLYRGTC